MIRAEHITRYYGSRCAVSDVSFEIGAHEVTGFLGKNGAGKSTMLKILSGVLQPSAGKLLIDDVDMLENPHQLRALVGYLPDRPPLYDDMSVVEMLAYAGALNGMPKERVAQRVPEVLELVALENVQNDLVGWLSHGYRQRVGIAQAIVHQPKLVILDEPISGLDPEQIVGMRSLISDLKEDHTVLISSHILTEMSQTVDRLLVIHEGKLVAQGAEEELTGKNTQLVELLIRGEEETLRDVMDAWLDETQSIEVTVESSGLLRVVVQGATGEACEAWVPSLVHAGLGVRHLAARATGLEEIFLGLTHQADAPPTSRTLGGAS
ncbi:MAG: ABC transporter ATP-binding protein [Deltaproteobacteria bacterium]|nr:ABC transporter ATP-binding protein [Deltaproteobacteria bacterium]